MGPQGFGKGLEMRRWAIAAGLKLGVLAIGLAALPLSGCTTLDFAGNSTFGSAQAQIKAIPDTGNMTADEALAEARNHFRNNDFGYSAALYKRVVELQPRNAEGYVGLGASYDRLGRFDLSDRVYASLYALTGGSVQYYNNVGYSQMLRGNLVAALTDFRKAQAMAPKNIVVANNLRLLATATSSAHA